MLGGQEHTPESVSALILRQLAAAAPGGLAGRPRVVITVPAYFGLAEREATYQAGVIAGLDVLELLDEPVAAAAHYGLATTGTRTVLVYDLGGGTFDTTVLQIADGVVTVLATDGHHQLGGADVDQRLLDLVLERLEHLIPPAEFDAFAEDGRRVSRPRARCRGGQERAEHADVTRYRRPHLRRAGHGHRQPGRSGGGLRRSLRHDRRDHRAGPRVGPVSGCRNDR